MIDRIDMRIPVKPLSSCDYLKAPGESSSEIRERVAAAVRRQRRRYSGESFSRNSRIPAGKLSVYCRLGASEQQLLSEAVRKLSLSSRAVDSVLKVARSIADLETGDQPGRQHLLEALQYRRYGDGNFFWNPG